MQPADLKKSREQTSDFPRLIADDNPLDSVVAALSQKNLDCLSDSDWMWNIRGAKRRKGNAEEPSSPLAPSDEGVHEFKALETFLGIQASITSEQIIKIKRLAEGILNLQSTFNTAFSEMFTTSCQNIVRMVSNVTFQLQDGQLEVLGKDVELLKQHSKFFERLFAGRFNDAHTDTIKVGNLTCKDLKIFISCLKGKEIREAPPKNFLEFFALFLKTEYLESPVLEGRFSRSILHWIKMFCDGLSHVTPERCERLIEEKPRLLEFLTKLYTEESDARVIKDAVHSQLIPTLLLFEGFAAITAGCTVSGVISEIAERFTISELSFRDLGYRGYTNLAVKNLYAAFHQPKDTPDESILHMEPVRYADILKEILFQFSDSLEVLDLGNLPLSCIGETLSQFSLLKDLAVGNLQELPLKGSIPLLETLRVRKIHFETAESAANCARFLSGVQTVILDEGEDTQIDRRIVSGSHLKTFIETANIPNWQLKHCSPSICEVFLTSRLHPETFSVELKRQKQLGYLEVLSYLQEQDYLDFSCQKVKILAKEVKEGVLSALIHLFVDLTNKKIGEIALDFEGAQPRLAHAYFVSGEDLDVSMHALSHPIFPSVTQLEALLQQGIILTLQNVPIAFAAYDIPSRKVISWDKPTVEAKIKALKELFLEEGLVLEVKEDQTPYQDPNPTPFRLFDGQGRFLPILHAVGPPEEDTDQLTERFHEGSYELWKAAGEEKNRNIRILSTKSQ